jgi:hypothetical protein
MSRVFVCFPTCNPERAATARDRWRAQGYGVAIWVEPSFPDPFDADLVVRRDQYPGYWVACNRLVRLALAAGADVVVCAGDDMDPDPSKRADVLGDEYLERFPDGYGVMQPTGDPMDLGAANRRCGSPWLGRGFILRAYSGAGPYHEGYRQFFGDEELFEVARAAGVLWQRPELTQLHHHWMRYGLETKTGYQVANDRWWAPDETLFRARKAAGFPGSTLVVP